MAKRLFLPEVPSAALLTRVDSSRFYASIVELRCLPRLSPEQPSPPAVGSDPHWAELSTALAGCVSLQAARAAQNKNCLKCTIPTKARWDGPVVINQVCKMRGCFPLCPLLPSGQWWGAGAPKWYLTRGRIPSSAAMTGTGHHWRSSRGNLRAQRLSGQGSSHLCCQLYHCKEKT